MRCPAGCRPGLFSDSARGLPRRFAPGYARIGQVNIFLHLLRSRGLFAGGVSLCVMGGALAITLGPNTRSALLGQPLDLSMQMTLDAGDDPQALCLDASVFYADKQLDKSQVQVAAEKSGNTRESVIRVRADVPVEGPVVTVHLRAGCAQKTMRRYVVLAATPRSAAPGDGPAVQLVAPTLAQEGPDKSQDRERELRQLREELIKAQAALADNKVQLQRAENEGFRKAPVYGLAGILGLALIGLFLVWRRRPRPAAAAASGLSVLPEAPVTSNSGVDLDIDESLFDGLKRRPAPSSQPLPDAVPPLPRRDRAKFSVSVPFVARTVRVPEIFDLQQQVEFFSSLGQHGKAIDLLRKHLVNNVKTSALVYLDLIDLYHQIGNREEYEVLRADFNRVFNTQVAPFDDYAVTGTNVSAYEDVLARIEAVWPKRRVFDIIDNALFREPGNPAEVLDLEAYRELLLLHAVAREIIDLEADASDSTFTSQWSELAMQPRSSPRLGLDIDLSEFAGGSKPAAGPDTRRPHAPASSPTTRSSGEPTVFDSLVDFDDYDTGFRPDDLGKA